MAQTQAAPRVCKAPWWTNPYRLAGAGVFAFSMSAVALLSSSKADNHVSLLVKDAALVISAPAKRPEQWGSLMRREAKDAVVLPQSQEVPAPVMLPSQERPTQWGHMMRREAKVVVPPAASETDTVVPALSREQPAHWGHMMRREAKAVVPLAASQTDTVVPALSREQPAHWGHMMRREAKAGVPPAASQTDNVVPALSREQPAHWGHMMRREAKIVPPPVTVTDASGTARETVRPSTFLAFFAAMVALVAFAQQMKTYLLDLFPNQSGLKGKAK